MLRITTEQKQGKVILSVEGRLAGPGVLTLEASVGVICKRGTHERNSESICAR